MRLQEPFDEEHDKVVVACWDVFAGQADAGPLSSQAAAADVGQLGEREQVGWRRQLLFCSHSWRPYSHRAASHNASCLSLRQGNPWDKSR